MRYGSGSWIRQNSGGLNSGEFSYRAIPGLRAGILSFFFAGR
jgi:hypothetical protein